MPLILGLDLSTQSFTGLVLDLASNSIVAHESIHFETDLPAYQHTAGHLPETPQGQVHTNPLLWLDACDLLFAKLSKTGLPMDQIAAISGSAQQHATVYLNQQFPKKLQTLNPQNTLAQELGPTLSRQTSPIWMDHSTQRQCDEINQAIGNTSKICQKTGSVTTARFAGPQIRKFYQENPEQYAETKHIHLVSSFFASILAGTPATIDQGDAAGMNLMNLETANWDPEIAAITAPNLIPKLPKICHHNQPSLHISSYFQEKYNLSPHCQITQWTGDNPASLVGMGASQPGKIVISLGTSDTLFAAIPTPHTDPNGYGHVFGNPTGGFMSILCFRNGSLAREEIKNRLNLTWDTFTTAALAAPHPNHSQQLILPFLTSEITPLRHSQDFQTIGWKDEPSPENWVRGILEAQFLNMKLHSNWLETNPSQILLTGGASKNEAISQLIADVFQTPVHRLAIPDSAALGAAIIAATSIGHDLNHLEKIFTSPLPGSEKSPNTTLAGNYQKLLILLQKNLKS